LPIHLWGLKNNHKKLVQIKIFNGGHLENMQINHVFEVIWPPTFFWDLYQLEQLKKKMIFWDFLGVRWYTSYFKATSWVIAFCAKI